MSVTESNSLTIEIVTGLYRSVEPGNARAFLDFLIDHPDQQFDSDRLQHELSFAEHKQVALAAYAIGELAENLGLSRPWTEGQKGYAMTAATARLFDQARSSPDVST